jgi:hypothetical protein
MKTLITLVNCLVLSITLTIFSSCGEESPQRKTEEQSTAQPVIVSYGDTPRGISVQKIDGCEYIYAETNHGVAICHKENCSNYIHQQ